MVPLRIQLLRITAEIPTFEPLFLVGSSKQSGDVRSTRFTLRVLTIQYTIMYGIVEIQGQQFKVENGDKLFVHHIKNSKEGDTVEFDRVLLLDNGSVKVGSPVVEGAKVVCEVIAPLVKGEKVLVFHKKRRKGYRKLNGHRQQFTHLSVKEIVG